MSHLFVFTKKPDGKKWEFFCCLLQGFYPDEDLEDVAGRLSVKLEKKGLLVGTKRYGEVETLDPDRYKTLKLLRIDNSV